jgi:hypothetical protein
MRTPADRFGDRPPPDGQPPTPADAPADRPGTWVSRRVAANGIVCVDWQQVSVGKHRAGSRCDVLVTNQLMQFWIGDDLLKTVPRARQGEVRKKRASGPRQLDSR